MKYLKLFVLFTTALNFYSILSWVYFFNTYNTHTERVAHFVDSWFVFSNAIQIDLFLIALNALSIFVLGRYSNGFNETFHKVNLILQILFLAFIGWSFL